MAALINAMENSSNTKWDGHISYIYEEIQLANKRYMKNSQYA